MNLVRLGMSDLDVGAVAYGCWRFAGDDVAAAQAKIEAALDAGMNLIDTADIYGFGTDFGFGGAESLLGAVLKGAPELRARMILATKGGITPPTPYDSSYDYLTGALDASLTRLGVDHVDLYQVHRPDLLAPVAETARALNNMVASGKARYIGISNFTVSQSRALAAHLDQPLISTQPEFSALEQSPITDGVLDWCGQTGAACLAWSPLAGGALATGVDGGGNARLERIVKALDKIAAAHDAARSQIAIAFTMRHPANVIPIIGTQRLDRINEAAGAAAITLSRREWYDVVEAYRGAPMP